MSSRKVFATVLGGLLLFLASWGRQTTPKPSPNPLRGAAFEVATSTRESYRTQIGPAAREHGVRIKAGEYANSLDEATAWAVIAKGIAKDSTDGISKAFAGVSEKTKDLDLDEGRQVRGDWFIDFGNGWDK